jgi:hypothetical protein
MDLDLGTALHDAVRAGVASRPELAPAPVMRRIRRRRAARTAGESTLGLAARGAVTFGTVQLVESRTVQPAPAPPATRRATPAPDDAPWRVVTPAGVLACGLPVPTLVDPSGGADLHLEPAVVPTSVASGEQLTVDAVLVNGGERDLDATAATGVRVWFAQDGTVVGTWTTSSGPAPDVHLPGGGDRVSQPQAGVPGTCSPDGAAPEALPPGSYDVYLSQTLTLADGDAVEVAGGPLGVLITDVAPVTAPPTTGTEAPDPDPHPAAERLVLSPAGLGPLAVGRPPATNPGAAMIEWDADLCAEISSESPGRWVPSGYAPEVRDGEPRPLFHVAADDQQVSRIDVLSATIRTAEGVGVGTTVDELRATYPQLSGPFEGPLSRVWWLTGPTGTLVLETQGAENGLQPEGAPASVILMRVVGAGVDPAYATANSGDVAGGCL